MEEFNKIYCVIQCEILEVLYEVLMVFDVIIGQNVLNQVKLFGEKSGVIGFVLMKLDGMVKGGIVVVICQELDLLVKMVGFGEKIDDLQLFDFE